MKSAHQTLGSRFQAIGIAPLAVGVFCALEVVVLFLLPNFTFRGPEYPPLAFESFWFQRHGWLSLQELLMWGHVLLAAILWLSCRFGAGSGARNPMVRLGTYVGAGLLLASAHWACWALSEAVPRVVLTRIHP